MKYEYMVKGRFIAHHTEDVTTEVVLPSNDELAKSLLSFKKDPYLVIVICHNIQHKVKITEMKTDSVGGEEDYLSIRGYVQNEETAKHKFPCYGSNYNWFYIGIRKKLE